ncbi:MAG: hypothetical protein ABIS28_07680 [Caldimonas sp.]
MLFLRKLSTFVVTVALLAIGSGCSTTSVLLTVAGASTDTSITWAVVKHVHAQLTEGDERPCVLLTSVQRALSVRCGAFRPGSLVAADIEHTGFAECALTLATRDPRLWTVLPELLDKGARFGACSGSPLEPLARQDACPDFAAASAESLRALVQIGTNDPRSVHHDVMRMLTCPNARTAGLDTVVVTWRSRGLLQPGTLGFSPLGALHPDALSLPIARDLEADGHTARAALGSYQGERRPGFEEALRTSHWAALDWWLLRAPELIRRVPPMQGNQLAWLPLARVLVPNFLARPGAQPAMVEFLLARGADPMQTLPSDPGRSVIALARTLKSPSLALLEATQPIGAGAQRFASATTTVAGE